MYSFDVFDTLIIRRMATPRGVFLLMQKRLEEMDDYQPFARSFALRRYEAEHNAEKYYRDKEIDIYDIYSVMAERCDLTSDQMDELIYMEIEIEKECAVLNETCHKNIRRLIKAGEKVILISDMYLRAEQIRSILCKFDVMFEKISIYVSCEYNATKSNGQLYDCIREKENIVDEKWKHYGDNIVADFNVPLMYGIEPVLIGRYKFLQIEMAMEEYFHVDTDYDVQSFLGMVKEMYMLGADTKRNEYAYRIGALCGGSVLLSYVKWIIEEATSKRVHKLLFMSRDGYLLQKIANLIIKINGLDITTDYIYVSKNVLCDDGETGELAVEYIKQFVKNESFALVDFQGTGNSVVNLAQKLGMKIRAFYYLLNGDPHRENVQLYGYTYEPIKSGLIEILCRARHGAVVGYKRIEGRIIPVLSEIKEETWIRSGFDDYEEGVCCCASTYISRVKHGLPEIDIGKISHFITRYLENALDPQLADFIGDFPHSDNNGGENEGFAPKLTRENMSRIYGVRGDEPLERYYSGSNIEYSIRRSSGMGFRDYVLNANREYINIQRENVKSRVILYGAGKYGYEAWYRLSRNQDISIVAWVDMNYRNINNGIVENPSVIKDRNYDTIIICLYDEGMYKKVRNMLITVGIEDSKIIWICDYWKGFFI